VKGKYIPRRKENAEFCRGVDMVGTSAHMQAGLSGREGMG